MLGRMIGWASYAQNPGAPNINPAPNPGGAAAAISGRVALSLDHDYDHATGNPVTNPDHPWEVMTRSI